MKIKVVTLNKVDYSEVEDAIAEHYGFDDYSLASAEEVGNDVSLEWDITGEVDEWGEKDIKERKDQYCTQVYMNDLARKGIIPKGTYLIEVSW